MIPLRILEFETLAPEKDWEKIKWATEQDDSVFDFNLFQSYNEFFSPVVTSRDWIGVMNEEKRTFKLITSDPRYFASYLGVHLHGQFYGNRNILKVVIRLDTRAFFIFVLFLLFLALMIGSLIHGSKDVGLGYFSVPCIYFIALSINVYRMDRRITRLLEL